MKRFLISLVISLVLIIGYLVISGIILVVSSKDPNNLDRSTIAMIDVPLRLPKYIFYFFFPPTTEDFSTDPASMNLKRGLTAAGFFVTNVVLYSLPIYLLLTLLDKMRRRNVLNPTSEKPPEPPSFN